MEKKSMVILFLIFLVFLLSTVVLAESEATSTSCGFVNSDLTLSSNITAAYNCLTLNASHITVDCDGKTIFFHQNYSWMMESKSGINNTIGLTNVTIKNCNIIEKQNAGIVSFATGALNFRDISNLTIYNNYIVTNSTYGIFLHTNVSSANITTNILDIRGGYGIHVQTATDVTIDANIISNSSTRHAIYLETMSGNITNNTINAHGDELYGLYISSNSINLYISNNSITTPFSNSLLLLSSSQNIVFDSDHPNLVEGLPISVNVSLQDVAYVDNDFSGILGQLVCVNCTNVTYSNVTIGTEGIALIDTINSTIQNCTINADKGNGIFSYSKNRATNYNTYQYNTIYTTGDYHNGIFFPSPVIYTYFNNFISNNITTNGNNSATGMVLVGVSNSTFVNNRITTNGTNSYGYSLAVLSYNIFNNSIVNTAAIAVNMLSVASYNNFTHGVLNSSSNYVYSATMPLDNTTFLNVTFNRSLINILGMGSQHGLIVKSYLNVYVNDTDGNPVEDAIITVFNNNSQQVEAKNTSVTGYPANLFELVEFFLNNPMFAQQKFYQTPHTIQINKSGYISSSQIVNLTGSAAIVFTITNTAYQFNLTQPSNQTIYNNTNATYNILLTNIGVNTDDYTVSVANQDSADTAQANASTISAIANSGIYTVMLTVGSSTFGTYETILVLTSAGNSSNSKNISVTTTINELPGTLSVQQITPSANANKAGNQTFTYNVTLTCTGGSCGNITALLDPISGCNPAAASNDECTAVCDDLAYGFTGTNWVYFSGSFGYCHDSSWMFLVLDDNGCNIITTLSGTGDCASYTDNGMGSVYYCPSYERNNNVAVTDGDCNCEDPGNCGLASDFLDFNHAFFAGSGGSPGGSSIKTGVVPNGTGTPFYTTSENPRNKTTDSCLENMDADSSCSIAWEVNATGSQNTTHTFFVIFTSDKSDVTAINSTNLNITIRSSLSYEFSLAQPGNQTIYNNTNATYSIALSNEAMNPDNYTVSVINTDNATVAAANISTITNIGVGVQYVVSLVVEDETPGTYQTILVLTSAGNSSNSKNISVSTTITAALNTQISNCIELQSMNTNLSLNYTLINDIDCSVDTNEGGALYNDGAGFVPIGNNSEYYNGIFDGQGFTITGLHINRNETDYVGLFGYVDLAGEIRNVNLVDVNITGFEDVGGLVGSSSGTITNSSSTGTVTGSSTVGGLVGSNSGTITNTYSTGNVTGSSDYVGGFVGTSYGTITNSSSTGTVTGSSSVGGLVGDSSGTITNSSSTGTVTGSNNVGGLVGYSSGTITNTYSTGTVTGISYVGGFVGNNGETITNSFSTGNVTGSNDYVGGFVGSSGGTITNTYSTGTVTGITSGNVGGLVGYNEYGIVTNSYSIGYVIGSNNVGGLVGSNSGTITDSFWDNETSGQETSSGGTGKTTAEMKNVSIFTDQNSEGLTTAWDFVDNPNDDVLGYNSWDINLLTNNGYPFLSWQAPRVLCSAGSSTNETYCETTLNDDHELSCSWFSNTNTCISTNSVSCSVGNSINEIYCETSLNQTYNLSCTWNNDQQTCGSVVDLSGGSCADRDNTDQNTCETALNSSCVWQDASNYQCYQNYGCCFEKECWSFFDESSCNSVTSTLGCQWRSGYWGGWCEELSCFSGDGTNATYCTTTLLDYGLTCEWDSNYNYCNPAAVGFSSCSDFITPFSCMQIGSCQWNGNFEQCEESGYFNFDNFNPGCGVFIGESDCRNITGCTWDDATSSCSGHTYDTGVQCSYINNSALCNGISILSTCCAYSGGSCSTTYDTNCYNIDPLPTGAQFCEDYLVFGNQTLCEQIAGSPWYMPCQWDTNQQQCKFNSVGGGFGGGFEDMTNEVTCQASGGTWRTETYSDGGISKTDSWCEFNFGSNSKSCDSSCWACETQPDGNSWSSEEEAETACEGSALGFCEFESSPYAYNGFGYCFQKMEFSYGSNCDVNCGDCNWMNNPESSCTASLASCRWYNDTYTGTSYCVDANQQTCDTNCFSCYSQDGCTQVGNGGNGSCVWDDTSYICKPTGFDGEICFDGVDNDNNGLIDCSDSQCSYDNFCGGGFFATNNCWNYATNETCTAAEGCRFILDQYDTMIGSAGHCANAGEQCWSYETNATCSPDTDCKWKVQGQSFCSVNQTLANTCNGLDNETCILDANCKWDSYDDGFGNSYGWCSYKAFSVCYNSTSQQSEDECTNAEGGGICGWQSDANSYYGGWCNPSCNSLGDAECSENSACQLLGGYCTAKNTGSGCIDYDGDQAGCELLNQTCEWSADANGPAPDNGWCNNKFMKHMFEGLDAESAPVILGWDDLEDDNNDTASTNDITGFGIKDNKNSYGLGITVLDSLENAAICNNLPLLIGGTGVGTDDTKFYWYLDTNGNDTDGCTAYFNTSITGFEFYLRYRAYLSSGEYKEELVTKHCNNGTWQPVPISLTTPRNLMCKDIGGGIVAIEKKSLAEYRDYNKSAVMRIVVATSDSHHNLSNVSDTAMAGYFSPGATDFAFQDCNAIGIDTDGDGMEANNDPDCFIFQQFGYTPIEGGPQCGNGVDDDGDGIVDCDDESCKYDPYYCSGTFEADPNDKKAPALSWLQVYEFVDGFNVNYDTDEPSNGTVKFFHNDSKCKTLNASILDEALLSDFMPSYSSYHFGQVNNFQYNSQPLSFNLLNGTTYYFKTINCDPSGNCAESKCTNVTTKSSASECTNCRATMSFDFTPSSWLEVDDPLGNLDFTIKLPNGTTQQAGGNAISLNYSQASNTTVSLTNPNATSNKWGIDFEGTTVKKLSNTAKNVTGKLLFNTTAEGDNFVGITESQCQILIQELRPSTLNMCIPGNDSELWQCNSTLGACINKTANATLVGYNSTTNNTCWRVPSSWGC